MQPPIFLWVILILCLFVCLFLLLLTSEAQGVEPGLPSPAAGKGSGSLRDQGSGLFFFFLSLGLFFRRGGITGASEPRCGAWPG